MADSVLQVKRSTRSERSLFELQVGQEWSADLAELTLGPAALEQLGIILENAVSALRWQELQKSLDVEEAMVLPQIMSEPEDIRAVLLAERREFRQFVPLTQYNLAALQIVNGLLRALRPLDARFDVEVFDLSSNELKELGELVTHLIRTGRWTLKDLAHFGETTYRRGFGASLYVGGYAGCERTDRPEVSLAFAGRILADAFDRLPLPWRRDQTGEEPSGEPAAADEQVAVESLMGPWMVGRVATRRGQLPDVPNECQDRLRQEQAVVDVDDP